MNNKKYKITSTIGFLLKFIHSNDPALNILWPTCIVATVALAVIAVAIPAVAVAFVEDMSAGKKIYGISILAILYFLFAVVGSSAENGRGLRQLFVGRALLYNVFLKRLKLNYGYSESLVGQNEYEKARQVCLWGADIRLVLEGIMEICVCILSFVLFSGAISVVSPTLIAIIIVMSVLNYFAVRPIHKANMNKMDEEATEKRKFNYLVNSIQNSRANKDIRLYNMANMLEKFIDKCIKMLGLIDRKYQKLILRSQIEESGISLGRNLVCYTFLIIKACRGEISISQFVLFFGAINQMSNFVNDLIKGYGTLKLGATGIWAVWQYLNKGIDAVKGEYRAEEKEYLGVSIEFKNVSFAYDASEPILNNVSFKVNAGEKVALVGVNGAGKTTIVKLICGLYLPQEGEILLDGKSVASMDVEERKKYLAVLFQESRVFPYTIAENVSMRSLNKTNIDRVIWSLEQAGMYEDICRYKEGVYTQLGKLVNIEGVEMSGGQLQKLLIARVLYKGGARVWILDEPTAALDPIAESEIYSKFNELCNGVTCIYISHRLASTRFLDRIIVLNNGSIIEDGSHYELCQNGGVYASLYEMQSHYYREEEINNGI